MLPITLVGAFAQGSTIGFIAVAIDRLRSPEPVNVPVVDAVLANTTLTLGIFGATLVLIMVTGAACVFIASKQTRSLARDFQKRCARRILGALASPTVVDYDRLQLQESSLQTLMVRDCTHLGKVMEMLINSAEPLARLLVCALILLYLDPVLTLTITPLFLLLVPLLYNLTTLIQRDAREYFERALSRMASQVRSLVMMSNQQNVLKREGHSEWLDEFYCNDSAITAYYNEYDNIQLARQKMRLGISLLNSVFLLSTLLVSGYLAVRHGYSWGAAIAYILAMAQVLNAVKTISGNLTSICMFYPAVERYRSFLDVHARGENETPHAPTDRPLSEIQFTSRAAIAESDASIVLRRGQPVYYWHPRRLSQMNLFHIIKPLQEAACIPEMRFWRTETMFICHARTPRLGALGLLMTGRLSCTEPPPKLIWALEELDLLDEFRRLPDGLETEVTAELWNSFSAEMKTAILLLPAIFDWRQLVLVDLLLLRQVRPGRMARYLDLLRDKLTLIVTSQPPPFPPLCDSILVAYQASLESVEFPEWPGNQTVLLGEGSSYDMQDDEYFFDFAA